MSTSGATFSRNPVLGYWLIKDATTGHSAIVGKLESSSSFQTPLLSSSIYEQLGAGAGDQLQSYYLGGDPKKLQTEVERGLGALQISTDTIPTSFQNLLHHGIQGVNFDLLAPTGANQNAYQQSTSSAGNTARQTTQTAASDASAIANFLGKLAAWNALRILELVGGLLLAYLAVRQFAGIGKRGV